MTPATADPELVRRVLAETGVDQAVRSGGWSGYLEALGEALIEGLGARLKGAAGLLSPLGNLAPLAAAGLAVLVLSILCVLAWRLARRRRGRPAVAVAAAPSLLSAAPVPELDRQGWRAELQRRLATGDVASALEALWWWFACSVATVRVDPAWTSAELLARCDRRDLLPEGRALDRLLYGVARPGVAELRSFGERLERRLA